MLAERSDGHGILLSALETVTAKLQCSPGTTSTWCFDEENMKPEKLTKVLENAGIDPSTMRGRKWYQEPTREDDDSHLPPSSRVIDAFTGTNRTSYQARESIKNEHERLSLKRGDMPPSMPKRVADPRIREGLALQKN